MRRRTERTQQVVYPPKHVHYSIDLKRLGGRGCHKWKDFIGMMQHVIFIRDALGKSGFFQEVEVPAFKPELVPEQTPHGWSVIHGYGDFPRGMINIYWRMQFSDEFEKAIIEKCLVCQ